MSLHRPLSVAAILLLAVLASLHTAAASHDGAASVVAVGNCCI